MDTVSYPDTKVSEFISASVIPLRLAFDAQPYSTDFNVKWTPTLVTADWTGKEHHRTVGFLPPEELIPSVMLGIAKIHFDLDLFDGAIPILDRILAEYPRSSAAPEAIFLRGVAGYKGTGDPAPLKQAYERLAREYPDSEWAKRALPYRLIP